jgi:hypothetical protein
MEMSWRRTLEALAILATCTLAGCSRIYFHNGPGPAKDMPPPRFHHDGLFGLVEFSEPEDLKEICHDREWSSVATENSFLTGLVSILTLNFYRPWAFSAKCE